MAFPDGLGGWTAAVNLNQFIPGINTGNTEYAATVLPDRRFLFFVRLVKNDAAQSGLLWVENPLRERNGAAAK